MKRTATWLLLLLILGAVGHMVHYYPLLPDTVASHFGTSGEPDGWTSKTSLIGIYGVMVALLGGLFSGLAVLIPRLPASLINVPNRDYWLAPERRQTTVAAITADLLWLGCATMAFVIATLHLAFLVNLGQRPGLGSEFWWLMGVYGAVVVGFLVWLAVRFKKPTDEV